MTNSPTRFFAHSGAEVPVICGAMYPCSNPELVAAVSEAGGIGIVQPISLTYVHGHELRDGLRLIKRLTSRPVGFNAIIEKGSKIYLERMRRWLDVALEEGIRFVITALGDPRWVVDQVHAAGGIVYHDVTERRFADKAADAGVDGLICVNDRAGGHAGSRSPEALYEELESLGLPLVCAGGVGGGHEFSRALALGYEAVQLGTRFIATTECRAHDDYKRAILRAREQDIVLTDKISGVPVSVIKTPYIEAMGTKANPLMRRLLRHPRTKHHVRTLYSLRSIWQLKRASLRGKGYRDYFQAGKSVESIEAIESAGEVVRQLAAAYAQHHAVA
jgi:nitronate monooxygenase